MQEWFSLNGRTAVVTGASRGLGQQIAIALAKAGADIIGVSRTEEALKDTRDTVQRIGRQFAGLACDQSANDQVHTLIREIRSLAPQVDVLVNNAGTIIRAPAVDYDFEDWRRVMGTNLDSAFLLCREVGKSMIEGGGGKIINIASLLSFFGGITVPAYAASKGGIALLTKALANEWGAHNVQVNAIAPGYFATDNTAALRQDPERSKEILSRIPAGRWGDPADLQAAAVFLASSGSDYVNGQVLLVDGGYAAR